MNNSTRKRTIEVFYYPEDVNDGVSFSDVKSPAQIKIADARMKWHRADVVLLVGTNMQHRILKDRKGSWCPECDRK